MSLATLILIPVVLILGVLLFVLLQAYLTQRSTIQQIRNLVDHLAHGRQQRRAPAAPGPAGELGRAINIWADALEDQGMQAQQDQDHLLALLKLLDSTDECVIAADLLDVVRLASPAAARVLERPIGQLLNAPVDEVLRQPELLALYRRAFSANGPVSGQITVETSGQPVHCQATATTIYNGPHYRGTLLLLRDVTEVVRTLQIKTDFVANASHELRTPLASIRAAVETLEETWKENPADTQIAHRCVGIIGSHALRLQMMVEDLLDLSRAEDPRAQVRRDPLDLAAICEAVVNLYAPQARDKGVAVQADLAPDARSMAGDERLMALTLKNLVDNAVKFTPAGGTVTVRARRAAGAAGGGPEAGGGSDTGGGPEAGGGGLALEVVDTGVGIPKEDQQRVFERFYTVNRSRGGADRGTGLGLAIVKHAVAAMGGAVHLESEVGKGTTVRCTFPLAEPSEG